jgi:hypothetical protein
VSVTAGYWPKENLLFSPFTRRMKKNARSRVGQTLKRGTKISSIRLTGNEDEVDCRHPQIKGLVLRFEFLKKA